MKISKTCNISPGFLPKVMQGFQEKLQVSPNSLSTGLNFTQKGCEPSQTFWRIWAMFQVGIETCNQAGFTCSSISLRAFTHLSLELSVVCWDFFFCFQDNNGGAQVMITKYNVFRCKYLGTGHPTQQTTLLLIKSVCSPRQSSGHCCDWGKYKETLFLYLCYRFHTPIWMHVCKLLLIETL